MKLLVLDGHDAAGKTTLARRLAAAVGARCLRPFGGEFGRRLIDAYRAGDAQATIAIGRRAILDCLASLQNDEPVVLDRGWLTVATLVPRHLFAAEWDLWTPVTLLWCNEAVTRARLREREEREDHLGNGHSFFLSAYLDRFELHPGEILRTDLLTEFGRP